MKLQVGIIQPKPKITHYLNEIENCISILEPIVLENISAEKAYLARWVSLKLIDGDKKILFSIDKNLKYSFSKNSDISLKLIEVKAKLSNENIDNIENFRDKIVSAIIFSAESLAKEVCSFDNQAYNERDRKIDKILTSKKYGIPIMILFLGIIFWITIVGANYPSKALSNLFSWLGEKFLWCLNAIHSPTWLTSVLIDGIYTTLTWVISVMLPPMAIFFPMFTLLEDLGYLPRISFNLDKYFRKACTSRKTGINYVHGVWL